MLSTLRAQGTRRPSERVTYEQTCRSAAQGRAQHMRWSAGVVAWDRGRRHTTHEKYNLQSNRNEIATSRARESEIAISCKYRATTRLSCDRLLSSERVYYHTIGLSPDKYDLSGDNTSSSDKLDLSRDNILSPDKPKLSRDNVIR